MQKTIFWHDYETFGADPRCDRPAQFAGVRTDEDLHPIGEPVALYCQPAPDFLPHPEACRITGITPSLALREGVREAEFAARIHAELAAPGTCGAGYNSVRFDDEVTRYLLFRNFYDPYGREWQNGNSRWDIIDLARMAYALRPEGVSWPLNDDGAPSFRLEHLSAANGLAHESAHDALSDVYATIALARKIRDAQPKLYQFLYGLRDKRLAEKQFDFLQRKPLLHTSRMFPAEQGCTTMVVPVARDPQNKNGVVVFDLRADPAPLLDLDADAIHERVFTLAADMPEGQVRIPLKTVHLNKCPALAPLNTLTPDAEQRMALDRAACEQHLRQIHAMPHRELEAKVQQALRPRTPFPDPPEAECALYGGFIPNEDKPRMEKVRALPPTELARYHPPFQDTRLTAILPRYLARNYPEILDAAQREEWEAYRRNRLANPNAGGLTTTDFFTALDQARETNPDRSDLWDDLARYAERILAQS